MQSYSFITVMRHVFLVLGFLFTGLAFAGIFLPLLPTTPFLLLAAACFSRSSPRAYTWLMQHKLFGAFLRRWRDERSISNRHRLLSLLVLWPVILIGLFKAPYLAAKIVMLIIGIGVSWYLLSLKTYLEKEK